MVIATTLAVVHLQYTRSTKQQRDTHCQLVHCRLVQLRQQGLVDNACGYVDTGATYRALRPLLPRVLNLRRLRNGAEVQRPKDNCLPHDGEICPHVLLRALDLHLDAHTTTMAQQSKQLSGAGSGWHRTRIWDRLNRSDRGKWEWVVAAAART